jgi:hypothetical protein
MTINLDLSNTGNVVVVGTAYDFSHEQMQSIAVQVKANIGAHKLVAFADECSIDFAELTGAQHSNGRYVRCEAIQCKLSIVIGQNPDGTRKSARGNLVIRESDIGAAGWATLEEYALFLGGYQNGVYYESSRWAQTPNGPRRQGSSSGYYRLVPDEGMLVAILGETQSTGIANRTQTPIASISFQGLTLVSNVPKATTAEIATGMAIQFDATGAAKRVVTLPPRQNQGQPAMPAQPPVSRANAYQVYNAPGPNLGHMPDDLF